MPALITEPVQSGMKDSTSFEHMYSFLKRGTCTMTIQHNPFPFCIMKVSNSHYKNEGLIPRSLQHETAFILNNFIQKLPISLMKKFFKKFIIIYIIRNYPFIYISPSDNKNLLHDYTIYFLLYLVIFLSMYLDMKQKLSTLHYCHNIQK